MVWRRKGGGLAGEEGGGEDEGGEVGKERGSSETTGTKDKIFLMEENN